MKRLPATSLITKTTLIYLFFTIIAFLLSSVIISLIADRFIQSHVEQRFKIYTHRFKHLMKKKGPDHLAEIPFLHMHTVADSFSVDTYSIRDTLVYDEDVGEFQRFRTKNVILAHEGKYYALTLMVKVDDFIKIRNDIIGSLFIIFGLLALVIILFNYSISGILFKPFNRILDVMRTYKVGHNEAIPEVKTSTQEFLHMQELFRQMVKQIEQDYRHLKEYTENMAHEVQTPLAIMRSKIEALFSDEQVMQKHQNEIKILYDEVNHLSRLGNALNLITRIENGEFTNKQSIQTRPFIEKQLLSFRELAEIKGMEIETHLSDELIFQIDPYLFEIVLRNLLRNAIQYGSKEGPIRVICNDKSLTISNYAPPLSMPAEQLFQRFSGPKKDRDSLGLGLSLVKKICEVNDLLLEYRYDQGQHFFSIHSPQSLNVE